MVVEGLPKCDVQPTHLLARRVAEASSLETDGSAVEMARMAVGTVTDGGV